MIKAKNGRTRIRATYASEVAMELTAIVLGVRNALDGALTPAEIENLISNAVKSSATEAWRKRLDEVREEAD
ncbi:MAG: hypothetical protein IKZ36_00945 [Kiritimatiellae bacterium]|nr:hypothetical protein [Kiritimatiellia bacterium]